MNFHRRLFDRYYSYRSARFHKKVLVIESDDWGSLRTESIEQRNRLNAISSAISKDRYVQLDGLASEADLQLLLDTLSSVKNGSGKSPVLTANFCVANPDFQRIKANGFESFHFETFHETIAKKKDGSKILSLWKSGKDNGLVKPQLHGREHLHALAWLAELKNGNEDLLKAFDLASWGIPYRGLGVQRRTNVQAALDRYGFPGEEVFQQQWLMDAAEIFKTYFGFNSESFIAPAYIWHSDLQKEMPQLGITTLQGIKTQRQPRNVGYRNKIRFIGEEDTKTGVKFFSRNVFFEPSLLPNKDWYSETLKGIEKAFANKQPAIIGSHRINFIGKLEESNRTQNLKTLKAILKQVVKRYPEVEFISSDKLVETL